MYVRIYSVKKVFLEICRKAPVPEWLLMKQLFYRTPVYGSFRIYGSISIHADQ